MQVLIAEDDVISRRVLEAKLAKWGYRVVATGDGEEAWDRLQAADAPKLAILDWMMPGMDGLDVCRKIRRGHDGGSYTYVILLTTKGQKEDVVAGMDAGADDYITKPFDSGELHVRLRAAKRVLDLESQLLAAQEALRDEALHDSLTGLWNRTAIIDILQKELSRSARDGSCVGVILADIDHFKKINDTCGHKAGDTVLCHATEVMQASLRNYDSIGRYGGEEFLIVMPGCDLDAAAARAEAIRAKLAGSAIPMKRDKVSLSVCMGVTTSHEHVVPDIDTLIQAADVAMYQAKRAGRNRIKTATRTVRQSS
jgi:diguanylate cyclase (GGDEF)-like protein